LIKNSQPFGKKF